MSDPETIDIATITWPVREYSTSTPMRMAQTRSPDCSFHLAADLFPAVSTIMKVTLRTTFAIAMQVDHTRASRSLWCTWAGLTGEKWVANTLETSTAKRT